MTQQRLRLPRTDKCVCLRMCVCGGGGQGGLCISEFVRGMSMWECACDLDLVCVSHLCVLWSRADALMGVTVCP